MNYQSVLPARFLQRPNRFIARVEVDGVEQIAHVRNTGRCKELLVPGATVYLEKSQNPARKTSSSLIAVEKAGRLINMDSAAPNRVVEEALRSGWLPQGFSGPIEDLRREATHGDSRFDFAMTANGVLTLLEVKGVTLEEAGKTYFPDAPTQRGVKHLKHLTEARKAGLGAWVVFVIQMADVSSFSPNDRTHPAFGEALREAAAAGVGVCACSCVVTPGSIRLDKEVPLAL